MSDFLLVDEDIEDELEDKWIELMGSEVWNNLAPQIESISFPNFTHPLRWGEFYLFCIATMYIDFLLH